MAALCARILGLPYDFPPGTEAVQLPPEKDELVADMADRVTPICDANLCDLLRAFLEHKRAEGSSIERELYARTGPCQLFTRLLCQRPLSFWTPQDKYVFPSTEGKRQLRGSWAWKARCATRILWQMVNLREKRRIQALASSQGQTINHSPHDPEQAQPSTGPRSEALASSQGQVRGVNHHRARCQCRQTGDAAPGGTTTPRRAASPVCRHTLPGGDVVADWVVALLASVRVASKRSARTMSRRHFF